MQVDLTQAPPRSPRVRLCGYVILARTIDKCRATLARCNGSYHFNCPLDERLFKFTGVKAVDFIGRIDAGASDDGMVAWLGKTGPQHSPEEILAWSEETEATLPYRDGDRRSWFIQRCLPLKLDPARTTLFDWLEVDDYVTFAKAISVGK